MNTLSFISTPPTHCHLPSLHLVSPVRTSQPSTSHFTFSILRQNSTRSVYHRKVSVHATSDDVEMKTVNEELQLMEELKLESTDGTTPSAPFTSSSPIDKDLKKVSFCELWLSLCYISKRFRVCPLHMFARFLTSKIAYSD